MGIAIAILVGTLTGILSGYGVGGGTLLMIYLTAFAGINQVAAQGINLIYFLPCSIAALVSHFKNGLVDKSVAIPAVIAGVVTTPLAAWLAVSIETAVLKKCFGAFLLFVGLYELFRKAPEGK